MPTLCIDWKQFAGQTITLAGAIHPWSNAITPLLWDFTKLTGISVITDFRLETTYLGALQVQLARGGGTPDVFMYTTYGQGISAGWLEPLNAHYSDKSLTDLGWYDEGDLLKTARAFPLWRDGERYAIPITSEAVTLFINGDALAAKNLPVPQTFDELLVTANAVKTSEMSGIAMRAQAGGNSSVPAMSFLFSYGGDMVKDNKAAFASPEAIAAIEMFGRLLSQAGSRGVSGYEWYHVLDDFRGRHAAGIAVRGPSPHAHADGDSPPGERPTRRARRRERLDVLHDGTAPARAGVGGLGGAAGCDRRPRPVAGDSSSVAVVPLPRGPAALWAAQARRHPAARSSSKSRSRALRVSDAARSNSARASSRRSSLARRSPRTAGRW